MIPPESERNRAATSAALNLGLQWAAGMALCAGAGYHIDRKRGGGSAFTLAGILLGLVYGTYELWKVVRAFNEADKKKDGPPPRHEQ